MYEVWFQKRSGKLFKVIVEAIDEQDARMKAWTMSKGYGKPVDCRRVI